MLNKRHVICKSSINATLPNSVVYVDLEVTSRNSCLSNITVSINIDGPFVINSYIRLVHIRCKLDSIRCSLEELSLREANSARLLLSYWSKICSIPDVLNFIDVSFAIDKSILRNIIGLERARIKAILGCCYYPHLVIYNRRHDCFNTKVSALPEITSISFVSNFRTPTKQQLIGVVSGIGTFK